MPAGNVNSARSAHLVRPDEAEASSDDRDLGPLKPSAFMHGGSHGTVDPVVADPSVFVWSFSVNTLGMTTIPWDKLGSSGV